MTSCRPTEFVPPIVHPVKVAILEALDGADQPLSPVELSELVPPPVSVSQVAYHALTLAQQGAIEPVEEDSADPAAVRYRRAPTAP